VAAASAAPDPKWKIARSFPRFATDLATKIHLVFAGETPPLNGKMTDIGLGGACVVVEQGTLGARQKVALEFRFPMSMTPLKLKATVRHCHDGNHYGFQFLELESEEREKIRRACSTLKII
jgi:c-di-GMP-binding flagellar brake protein YcgR